MSAVNVRNLLLQDSIMENNVELYAQHAKQLVDNMSEKMENVRNAQTTAKSQLTEENVKLFLALETPLLLLMVSVPHALISLLLIPSKESAKPLNAKKTRSYKKTANA